MMVISVDEKNPDPWDDQIVAVSTSDITLSGKAGDVSFSQDSFITVGYIGHKSSRCYGKVSGTLQSTRPIYTKLTPDIADLNGEIKFEFTDNLQNIHVLIVKNIRAVHQ